MGFVGWRRRRKLTAGWPIPALKKDAPSSSFKSKTGFIVDLLTPQRRRSDTNPLPLENLAAGAIPLQHLDWLIADPVRAVALHSAGKPGPVPQSAKYAAHKLIVEQKRHSGEPAKRSKDLHWNVTGHLFVPVHTLTEEQYRDLFEAADILAERVRALGYPAPGSFEDMKEVSIVEATATGLSATRIIESLANDHEAMSRRMRAYVAVAEKLHDTATADMLTARIEIHEKAVWMLRAMLSE